MGDTTDSQTSCGHVLTASCLVVTGSVLAVHRRTQRANRDEENLLPFTSCARIVKDDGPRKHPRSAPPFPRFPTAMSAVPGLHPPAPTGPGRAQPPAGSKGFARRPRRPAPAEFSHPKNDEALLGDKDGGPPDLWARVGQQQCTRFGLQPHLGPVGFEVAHHS